MQQQPNDPPPPNDTPMDRQRFVTMTEAQQLAFLEGIRERRLSSLAKYQEKQAAIKDAKNEKLATRIEKSGDKIDKQLTKILELLDKVDADINKHIAMQLMLQAEEDA